MPEFLGKYFILVSTFHDPDSSLLDLLKKTLPDIKELFEIRVVCCTPSTDEIMKNLLIKEGFKVITSPSMRQVETYRSTIQLGIDSFKDFDDLTKNGKNIFHIDFDRLLHWISKYPAELRQILIENKEYEFVHIGRTTRAFETHPITQKKTEIIVNQLGSKVLGFTQTHDILSVCYIITKKLAEKLLKVKNRTSVGFYCTWPIYLWSWSSSNKYLEVEGHEWETPDRFKKEILEIGYDNWVLKFQNSSEWKKRVRFIDECMEELFEISNFTLKK
ncbi:MAG: hypothetical protein GY870_21390 [archaeon]|nr:hypothetical protein [archaeon]